MAGNLQNKGIVSIGKRVIKQICGETNLNTSSYIVSLSSRAVHGSVYEKNQDEHVRPSFVPDEVIHPQSDKYWAPHPETGVFGPVNEETKAAGAQALPASGSEDSVLEQKAFFRPVEVEDLEKPPV